MVYTAGTTTACNLAGAQWPCASRCRALHHCTGIPVVLPLYCSICSRADVLLGTASAMPALAARHAIGIALASVNQRFVLLRLLRLESSADALVGSALFADGTG